MIISSLTAPSPSPWYGSDQAWPFSSLTFSCSNRSISCILTRPKRSRPSAYTGIRALFLNRSMLLGPGREIGQYVMAKNKHVSSEQSKRYHLTTLFLTNPPPTAVSKIQPGLKPPAGRHRVRTSPVIRTLVSLCLLGFLSKNRHISPRQCLLVHQRSRPRETITIFLQVTNRIACAKLQVGKIPHPRIERRRRNRLIRHRGITMIFLSGMNPNPPSDLHHRKKRTYPLHAAAPLRPREGLGRIFSHLGCSRTKAVEQGLSAHPTTRP